jgi:aspartate/methionine/tyrosine aminotransferase
LSLGYTESPGFSLLRKEIASLYPTLNSDQILTLAGAEEGIYCSLRVLLKPGDHVVLIDPCYQSLETLPTFFGAEITKVALNFENQWKLELEEVKKAFQKNTKLLILNYPHNPTGTLLEKEVYEGLIELARVSNAYIFSDEVYRYLEIDESKRLPSIAEAYEKGITLNVMTKALGLAGLRIGWIATQDAELLEKIGSYKLYTSICNSAPSEILAIIGLRAKDHLLNRNRELILNNLTILDSFMKRHEKSLSWVRPQSGTVALLKLLLPVSIDQFTKDLVEATGVLIMPGSAFDLPGNYFRIGFGKKNMKEVLNHFEKFLNTYETNY